MKIMYVEIRMTDEQSEKLKKWEQETGKSGEELTKTLLLKFIDGLSQ